MCSGFYLLLKATSFFFFNFVVQSEKFHNQQVMSSFYLTFFPLSYHSSLAFCFYQQEGNR